MVVRSLPRSCAVRVGGASSAVRLEFEKRWKSWVILSYQLLVSLSDAVYATTVYGVLTTTDYTMENGQSRLHQAQEGVEEIKVIMLENFNKADERAGKLVDLEDRADKLLEHSEKFSKTSIKVKQKKRWESKKYKVIIAAVVAAVVLGIIVAVVVSVLT